MSAVNLLERLSKRVPESFSLETLSVYDVCISTERFFDENFRGAVSTCCEVSNESFISASPTGIAYFYRLLLEYIFGEGVLYVKMQTNNYKFVIHNKFSIGRGFDSEIKTKLQNVARVSGFDIKFTSEGENTSFDIIFDMRPAQAIPIYARSARVLLLYYVDVFFY